MWGAAIGAAWNGNHYGTNWSGGNNNITINRNTNINTGSINTGNINTGNINRAQQQPAQNTAWKSDKKPGQVSSGAASRDDERTCQVMRAPPAPVAGAAAASTSVNTDRGRRGTQCM